MKKWKFTLEPVREHRMNLEEQAATKLAEELKTLATASEEVRRVREQALLLATRCAQESQVDSKTLQQWCEFHQLMQERLQRALAREKQAGAACETARARWMQARMDKEAVEKIRETHLRAHAAACLAQEQQVLDEFRNDIKEAA